MFVTIFRYKLLSFIIFFFLISCDVQKKKIKVIDSFNEKKTNVVLILIDDLSHLGVTAYGANRISSNYGLFENIKFQTKNIDALASEGVLCKNAFAYPLCEPTRIALMSGKHNQRNFLQCKAQHGSDITFGDVFKREGYATGVFGKWKQSRGTNEIPGEKYIYEFGWDEFTCFDVTMEGQRFINPNLVVNGKVENYKGRKDVDPQTGRRWYGPDICNRNALKFIDNHKNEPFFLYYPMLLVHDDHKPTPDTKPNSLFDNFDEANNNRDGHTGDDPKYFPEMLTYMDKLIGKVVAKLEEHHLREKTLIVVMGDNGTKEIFTHIYPNNNKYPARKGGTADNGIHVPLVFSQPKTISNESLQTPYRIYEGLVDVTDIFPTICEAVGITIPYQSTLDGISFWPQLTGNKKEHRNQIYTWYNGNDSYKKTDLLLRYSFDKNFKYYAPSSEFPKGRFFDLRVDPLERVGDHFKVRRWGVRLYNGLDISKLTKEQQAAFERLKILIESKNYKPIISLEINTSKTKVKLGEELLLQYKMVPKNATRNNIIWSSNNTSIAKVDKFGTVSTIKKGKVIISIYSWDDALPVSNNQSTAFFKQGITDTIELEVY